MNRSAAVATPELLARFTDVPNGGPAMILEAGGRRLTDGDGTAPLPVVLRVDGRLISGEQTLQRAWEGDGLAVATVSVGGAFEVRLSWSRRPSAALALLVQARSMGPVLDCELDLPVLRRLVPPGLDRHVVSDSGVGPLASDGRRLVRSTWFPLPFACWSERHGIAVLARCARSTEERPEWQPVRESFPVRLRQEWLDVCELVFQVTSGGWLGAFAALRDQVRAGISLTQYARPDLVWYREQWVQHFAFLYGAEIFDHVNQRLDVDHLLAAAAGYGGFDATLLWPGYPRLGVDERSQWDFYDDVPGGRAALKALSERARDGETRVFVPYLPWDSPPESRHGVPAEALQELARLVAEVGPDGIFLDTMDGILPEYRAAIDHVRPGVVFCSERDPTPAALEFVTGSWDQAEHRHPDTVDLLRFLLPEHRRFVVNRHAVGDHRRRVIASALFNGTGLVVWQDVFGEVLPYTPEEVALIATTAGKLRHLAAWFRGAEALPLVPTAHRDVSANAFLAEGGRAVITACNGGGETIRGDLVTWTHDESQRWSEVIEEGVGAAAERARGTLAPGDVKVFVSDGGG